MKKIICVIILLLLITVIIIPTSVTINVSNISTYDEAIDQYQELSDECYFISNFEWQEFIPTQDNLVRVEVKIAQWYEGSPNLELSIERPLGTVLTSIELPASVIPAGICNWVSFNIPDISLSIGESYYIKLTAPIGSEYGWGIGWNNPYIQGESSRPPGDWCFRTYAEITEDQPPWVKINYPSNGETVNGEISIAGEAHDPNGDEQLEWVYVSIDNGEWLIAQGTSSWNMSWDSRTVDNGKHIVSAKAYDGNQESPITSVEFFVENEEAQKQLKLKTNRNSYRSEEEIAITIENICQTPIQFFVYPKIEIYDKQDKMVFPQSTHEGSWILEPGEKETYAWNQIDLFGNLISPGEYYIKTVSELTDSEETTYMMIIHDIGYVILLAGNADYPDDRLWIPIANNQIYDDLLSIGYTHDKIFYLSNFTNTRIDAIATSTNFENAIKVWAAGCVNPYSPLFILMYDHGAVDAFAVFNNITGYDSIFSWLLADWIDELYLHTGAPIHVWIMACFSGSFINDLSTSERVIITTCNESQGSPGVAIPPYNELFTLRFWPSIKRGLSWGEAFNDANLFSSFLSNWSRPLLDDNGDGVGHGWFTPLHTGGALPHNGDGTTAMRLYMGRFLLPSVPPVTIRSLIPRRYYTPFPPHRHSPTSRYDSIELWAIIESRDTLAHVNACMIPPNCSSQGKNCWEKISLECFSMTDDNKDGNWTVEIPITNFTKYSMDSENFDFIITAETENGEKTKPLITGIGFTETGVPPSDNKPPCISIISPTNQQIVKKEINVTGYATDNLCLQKIEIYLEEKLVEVINLIPSSNSLFEYAIDTTGISEDVKTIRIIAYDTSGNTGSQYVNVTLVNSIAPMVEITRPRGFYIFDQEIMHLPFDFSIIIGSVTISANTIDKNYSLSRVEFYVDNEFKATEIEEPYSWLWDEGSFGKHTVKIKAYDFTENIAIDDITVWKLF